MPGLFDAFDADLAARRTGIVPPAEVDPGFFSNLGNFFLNVGTGALDVLDRPGRAVRHALVGDFRQAAESFDPFNLLTPGTASQPIFGKDVLAQYGVEEGPSVGPLGSTRAIGGFFLDLVADPLTYVGLPGGAQALRGAQALGRGTVRGLEAWGARGGVSGVLAKGVLGAGELVSDPLRFRGAPEHLARRRLMTESEHVGRAVARAEAHEWAKVLTAARKVEPSADKYLLEATSAPGMRTFLEERGLLPKTDLPPDYPFLEPTANALAGNVDTAAKLRDTARRTNVALAEEIWNRLPKVIQEAAPLYYTGSPLVRRKFGQNLGKLERERRFLESGVLTAEQYQNLMRKTGEAHVIHARDPRSFAQHKMAELLESMGESNVVDGLTRDRLLHKAARTGTIRQRQMAETLLELDEIMPGAFYTHMDEIARAEMFRYVSVDSTHRFLAEIAQEPNVIRPAEMLDGVPVASRPGWKVLSEADLASVPKATRRYFEHEVEEVVAEALGTMPARTKKVMRPVQMPTVVWHDLSTKILPRLVRDPAAEGFKQLVNTVTRMVQGWTISPLIFPSTGLSNAFGGVWNNWLMGGAKIAKDYPDAARAMMGAERNAKGIALGREAAKRQGERAAVPRLVDLQASFEGTIRPDGTMEFGEFLREVRAHRVVAGGFYGTDFGEQLARHAFDPVVDQPTWAQKILDPALNPVTRAGYHVMTVTDDLNRLAHYLHLRRQGQSASEAAASVKRWLYAGDTLTDAEKTFARPVFPFYGFARFNIPQQARAFLERPQRFARFGRLQLAADRDGRVDVPEALIPDILESQANVLTGRDAEGRASVYLLGRWIPFTQINEIGHPKRLIQFLLSQVQPQARAVVEANMNWSSFFRDKIVQGPEDETEAFLGMRTDAKWAHFWRSFRVLNEADKVLARGLGLTPGEEARAKVIEKVVGLERVASTLTGKSFTVDYVTAKAKYLKRAPAEITRLRREQARLERLGLPREAEALAAQAQQEERDLAAVRGWDPRRASPTR